MAIKIHSKKKAKKINIKDGQIPISESAVEYKQPFEFTIETDTTQIDKRLHTIEKKFEQKKKRKLIAKYKELVVLKEFLTQNPVRVSVKQLTTEEYLILVSHLMLIKQTISNLTDTNVYDVVKLKSIVNILAQFCDVRNPEILVKNEINEIIEADDKSELSFRHYKTLLNYKQHKRLFFLQKLVRLRRASLGHLQKLARNILHKKKSELLITLPYEKLLVIANKVVSYNDVLPELKKKDHCQN